MEILLVKQLRLWQWFLNPSSVLSSYNVDEHPPTESADLEVRHLTQTWEGRGRPRSSSCNVTPPCRRVHVLYQCYRMSRLQRTLLPITHRLPFCLATLIHNLYNYEIQWTIQAEVQITNGYLWGRMTMNKWHVKMTWFVRGFLFFIAKSCYMV